MTPTSLSTTSSYNSIPSATTPNVSTSSSSKSISKKTKINKKKLEFAAKKCLEPTDDEIKNYEELDTESLKTLVEEKRKQLEVLDRHKVEKEELTNLTERWKQAGVDGIERLRTIIRPPRSDGEILDSFKIPREMFL